MMSSQSKKAHLRLPEESIGTTCKKRIDQGLVIMRCMSFTFVVNYLTLGVIMADFWHPAPTNNSYHYLFNCALTDEQISN